MKKRLSIFIVSFIMVSIFLSTNIFALEVTHKLEFTDSEVDENATEITDLIDMWEVKYGTPTSSAVVSGGEDGNKYLAIAGYVSISSYDMLEAPYTYSLDVKMVEKGNVAFFTRCVVPVQRNNPKGGGNMTISYYEADWYKENGGTNGETMTGGSGIAVYPLDNSIRVNIKTYVAEAIKLGNKHHDFPLPEGFDYSKYFNIKFVDNNEKVEIFINNNLLASIEMSEKGVYEEDGEDENEYLKKAVMKDAQGNEVLNIDNARISSGVSQVAIGSRNKKINVDNVTLSYTAPDPTPTPEVTPTPERTATPVRTTVPATQKPDTVDEEDGLSTTLIIAIVAAVVVVGAVVAGIIIAIKKKKT